MVQILLLKELCQVIDLLATGLTRLQELFPLFNKSLLSENYGVCLCGAVLTLKEQDYTV